MILEIFQTADVKTSGQKLVWGHIFYTCPGNKTLPNTWDDTHKVVWLHSLTALPGSVKVTQVHIFFHNAYWGHLLTSAAILALMKNKASSSHLIQRGRLLGGEAVWASWSIAQQNTLKFLCYNLGNVIFSGLVNPFVACSHDVFIYSA